MYKFNFKEKDYELTTENCEYFLNDEESEVKGASRIVAMSFCEPRSW